MGFSAPREAELRLGDAVSFALKGASRRTLPTSVIVLSAAAAMGLFASVELVSRASETGMRLGLARLGADAVVVPEGTEDSLYETLVESQTTDKMLEPGQVDAVCRSGLVAETTPQIFVKSLSGASCCSLASVLIVGFEPETDFVVRPWLARQRSGVLGSHDVLVGSALGLEVGDTLKLFGTSLEVAGVLEPTALSLDMSVFVPIAGLRQILIESAFKAEKPLTLVPDRVSTLLVRLSAAARHTSPEQAAAILRGSVPGIAVVAANDLMVRLRGRIEAALERLSSVRVIVGSLTTVLLVFSLVLSVHARRMDISLLLALGATARDVVIAVVIEFVALVVSGVIVGFSGSVLGVFAFEQLLSQALGLPLHPPPLSTFAMLLAFGLAAGAALSALIGSAASLYVSRRSLLDALTSSPRSQV